MGGSMNYIGLGLFLLLIIWALVVYYNSHNPERLSNVDLEGLEKFDVEVEEPSEVPVEVGIYHSYYHCSVCGNMWTRKLPLIGTDRCRECGSIFYPRTFYRIT